MSWPTARTRRSRIDDGSDERDLDFYNRQLLPDFVKGDVELAYRIASDALPFGFEFVRKVVFRDINFGRFAATGDATLVGGREAVRRGFRLCRHCGKVQSNGALRTAGTAARRPPRCTPTTARRRERRPRRPGGLPLPVPGVSVGGAAHPAAGHPHRDRPAGGPVAQRRDLAGAQAALRRQGGPSAPGPLRRAGSPVRGDAPLPVDLRLGARGDRLPA